MLEGKVALVTGAGRGIGEEIALTLAEYGADVIVNYNGSKEKAEKVAAKIEQMGRKAVAVQCSVADFEACGKMITDMMAEFGHIDILVNNAGITKDNLVIKMTEQDFDAVIDTNLKGTFNTIKHMYRPMIKQKAGRIINLSSVTGVLGNAGQANYAASKAGVIGLTKSMARELASRNITVNAVAPGFIDTDMTQAMTDAAKEATGGVYQRLYPAPGGAGRAGRGGNFRGATWDCSAPGPDPGPGADDASSGCLGHRGPGLGTGRDCRRLSGAGDRVRLDCRVRGQQDLRAADIRVQEDGRRGADHRGSVGAAAGAGAGGNPGQHSPRPAGSGGAAARLEPSAGDVLHQRPAGPAHHLGLGPRGGGHAADGAAGGCAEPVPAVGGAGLSAGRRAGQPHLPRLQHPCELSGPVGCELPAVAAVFSPPGGDLYGDRHGVYAPGRGRGLLRTAGCRLRPFFSAGELVPLLTETREYIIIVVNLHEKV